MKSILKMLVVGLVMFVAIAAQAQIVSITPVLLPLRDVAGWETNAASAIQAPKAHTSLVWSNLWQMNPSGVLWYRIEVRSALGTDSISINGLSISTRSNDGGYLDKTGDVYTAYSDSAPGWKANGEPVSSGSENVARFVLLYRPKLFNPNDGSSVQSWVNSFPNYTHTVTASIGGKQVERSLSRSSSLSNLVLTSIGTSKTNVSFKVTGTEGNSYVVYKAPAIGDMRTPVLTVTNNQTFSVPVEAGTNLFYQAGL